MRMWTFWDKAKRIRQIQTLEKAKFTALCQLRARQSSEAVLCRATSIRVVAKGSCSCWHRDSNVCVESSPYTASIGRRTTRAFRKEYS
jgi:hypothetical protein